MKTDGRAQCTLCGADLDTEGAEPAFAEAGKWLAEHHWQDVGTVCSLCLENRGRLAMMYLNEAEI